MVYSKKEPADIKGSSDITERLKVETALEDATRRLQESEKLFRSLFEQSQDGFLLADDQLRIVAWNPAQERITGLSREQVMGRSVVEVQLELMPDDLHTPARLEQIRGVVDRQVRGEGASGTYGPHQAIVQRPDGSRIIVDQYIFPIQMAHGKLICGLCRNVSERQQAQQRLETLQAANAALTQLLDLDAVLESLLDYLGELIPYDTANVMLRTGDAMVAVRATRGYERWNDPALSRSITFDTHTNLLIGDVLNGQRSVLVPDTRRAAGWQRTPGAQHVLSWLGVPLVVGGRVLGLFSVDKAEADFFRPEHVRLAEALAPQAAVAIQNARLHAEVKTGRDQLQALSRRLVELQEEERRALSRDLHDTAGQSITALKLGLGALKREAGGPKVVRARIDDLLQMTDTVSEDLHRLAVDLRPSSLDRYGLVPALEQLLTEWRKKTGLKVEFLAQGMDANRLPAATETVLYRVVQEALTNCARYAQAAWVSVMVQRDGDFVRVIVEDDGQGFNVEEALQSGRLGLLGMRERAEMLGGTLDIESRPDSGTSIYATVPTRRTTAEGSVPERSANRRSGALAAARVEDAGEPASRLAEAAELARTKALTDVLIDITTSMAQYSDAGEFLRLVFERATEAIGCDDAYVALREDGQWDLRHSYREGVDPRCVSDLEAPAFVWVEQTRQALVVDETSPQHLRDALQLDAQYVKSYLCVPLLIGDRLLGVLSFANYSVPMASHPSEIAFLNRLAILVAFALENARLREIGTRQRDELAQRVEELQSLLDLLPVGIGIAHDPACKDVRVNPAAARMLAVSPDANASLSADEAERPTNFKIYLDGRELAADELPMQVAAAQGTEVQDVVVDLVRDDGTTLHLLEYAVPLFDGQNKPRGSIGALVDVTGQHRAQAEAEAARQMLEALLKHIPEGITIADAPDGRIRYVSRHVEDETGGSHQGRTVGEIVAEWPVYEPDGITRIAEADLPLVRAIRYGETVRDREIMQVTPQGRRLSLLCNAGPIRDQEGRITGGILAWHGIAAMKTAQSRTEAALQALRQSEERYRSLFNGMTEGFALHETVSDEHGKPVDCRFLTINPAFERLTGLKRDEVEGRLVSELFPGDDPYWLETYGQVALTGEALHFERYSLALGRWYDLYAYCPAPRQVAVIFTEITERRRADEELRKQREQYQRLASELEATLSSVADGLIVYDLEGRIVRMNAVAEEMLGFSPDLQRATIAERARAGVKLRRPDGSPFPREAYPALRALGGETVRNQEMIMAAPVRPGGELRAFVSSAPIRGQDGSIIGCVTTFADISELHRISDQLRLANQQLQAQADALSQREAALREAAERLEQRVRERTFALDAANARLQFQAAVLANANDAIIGADTDLRITAWNRAAEEQYGWSAEEAIGYDLRDVLRVQLSTEEWAAALRLLAETGRWRGEATHLRRDGTPFWVESNVTALRDRAGAIVAYATVNRDVTARKQAEEAIQRHAARGEALIRTAQRLNAQLSLEAVLTAVCEEAARALRSPAASVALYDGTRGELRHSAGYGLPPAYAQRAGPIPRREYDGFIGQMGPVFQLPDVRALASTVPFAGFLAELGIRSAASTRIVLNGELIGVLTVFTSSEVRHFSDDDLLLLQGLANQAATAIANARLHERVRASQVQLSHREAALHALSHRLVESQERERSYVADRLYNEAAQVLAALKMQMSMLERDLRQLPASTGYLGEMTDKMDRVLRELHHLAAHLRPAVLDRLGLAAALQQHLGEFGRQYGVAVHWMTRDLEGIRLPYEVETAVFRMAQEVIANVAQHARASHVELSLTYTGVELLLIIHDDGLGFDVQEALRHGALGLVGMRERTEALGGRLEIESAPGAGTTIIVELPL